jgi:uncharacterized spore protein YtfJ
VRLLALVSNNLAKGDVAVNEAMNEFLQTLDKESEGTLQTMQRLLSAADAARVFSQPVTSGEYTVITAAEVAGGGGFGSGMGYGVPRARRSEVPEEPDQPEGRPSAGAGRGGGGGGGSIGRPVAAIVVGPEGVEVKPIFDLTKVGLAALTAWGAVAALGIRTLKKQRPRG